MSILPNNSNNNSVQSLSFSDNSKSTSTLADVTSNPQPVGPVPLNPSEYSTPKPATPVHPINNQAPKQSPTSDTSFDVQFGDLDDVNEDSLEKELSVGMERSMNEVEQFGQGIKKTSGYDICTIVGQGATKTIIFNVPVTKDTPFMNKAGKELTRKVNLFGMMTLKGNFAVRVPSTLRPKFEDALEFTKTLSSTEYGLTGSGLFASLKLKASPEQYGENASLTIPLATEEDSSLDAHGLDFIVVPSEFVSELLDMITNEVQATVAYNKTRQTELVKLREKQAEELKKATMISSKLKNLTA